MKIGEHEVVVVSNDAVKVGCQQVSRDQVERVLTLMAEWKPAPSLKVGNYVKIKRAISFPTVVGRTGKVVYIENENSNRTKYFAVEFAEFVRELPGCTSNKAKTASFDVLTLGHGAWFETDELELVP